MRRIYCECQALKTFMKKQTNGESAFLAIYWFRGFGALRQIFIYLLVRDFQSSSPWLYFSHRFIWGLNLKAPFLLACTPYSLMLSFNTVRESKCSS